MGTATRVHDDHARPAGPHRTAAARAQHMRRQRRRRVAVVVGASVAVLGVVVVMVAATATSRTRWHPVPRRTAPAALVAAVAGVPASTLDAVGVGAAAGLATPITDQPLLANGLPEVLYVGAEYCPFCAVERWPLVQALSRFGTWSGLKTSASAPNDAYPNTPTFSFYGATYTSSYLSFVGKELATNVPEGKHYGPLEQLTQGEAAVYMAHAHGTPFIDIGGRYVVSGATYDPRVLAGLTAARIAALLSDPATPVAQGILGAANGITATLCRLTAGQPARVCTAPAVRAYAVRLPR